VKHKLCAPAPSARTPATGSTRHESVRLPIANWIEFSFNLAMPIYVAMLRGINVSGQKIIKMESLRESFESLGLSDVKTYIQSGNVIFKSAKAFTAGLARKIAAKILHDFGFSVFVQVRTPEELGAVLKGNSLLKQAGIDASKLHLTFLSEPAPKMAEEILEMLAAKSERFLIRGREIYLYCPDGYGNTKLSNRAIEEKLSLQATTRNWKTVNVLFAMTQT
jgi:uncharacterized protein (DUF1697 family)